MITKINLVIVISVLLGLITISAIFLGFSLQPSKRKITPSQIFTNIDSFEWSKTWGGNESEEVSGMALDSSGNIFIIGTIGIYDGEGKHNVFLLKYNSDGNLLWIKTWGRSRFDYGYSIVVDSTGNAYVAGTDNFGKFYPNIFIRKYDSAGTLLWAEEWGGFDAEWAPEIALDTSGNVFVVGSTDSYGAGSSDAFLLKLDSSGNYLWYKTWGGSEMDLGSEVVLDDSGNAIVMGEMSAGTLRDDIFLLKYDSTGTLQWNKTWGGSSPEYGRGIALDGSGNAWLTGESWSYGSGHSSVFLLKYDSSGNLLCDKTWGRSGGESVSEIAIGKSGDIYLTGDTSSYRSDHCDVFILKYDSSGNLMWDQTWGGSANDYGRGIVLETSGNIYITGNTRSYQVGYSDVFLLKYNSSGNILFAKTGAGPEWDRVNGIALDSSGNTFIAGNTRNYGERRDLDASLLKHGLDTDNDGLSDSKENLTYFTEANNSDTDSDGLSDGWEVNYGLNATWSNDASLDGDNDGLINLEEYLCKTDPTNSDIDGDGLRDGDEVNKYHTDPTHPDSDGDRYSDKQEIELGTDPISAFSNPSTTLTIIILVTLSVGLTSIIIVSIYHKNHYYQRY